MTPPTLAVVCGSFTVPGPAQQLLDRLLAGYARDGAFQPRAAGTIRLFCPEAPAAEVARRRQDFGLESAPTLEAAAANADAALVVWPGPGHTADTGLLKSLLGQLRPGSHCFVHGVIGASPEATREVLEVARNRDIRLTSATALATAFRLPDVHPAVGQRLAEALIVVQGTNEDALLDGVEGLLPALERGGVLFSESGPAQVQLYQDDALWQARDLGRWSGDLLAAALSRSNNPQGDPVADGRTQDLYGLGLVPRLARNPRAWITQHSNGAHSTILALDGVVTDVNLAWRTQRGVIGSTQLYRPPAPGQHGFDALVAVVDDFFRGRELPWSKDRARNAALWLGALRAAV